LQQEQQPAQSSPRKRRHGACRSHKSRGAVQEAAPDLARVHPDGQRLLTQLDLILLDETGSMF
jgi:hypothetical protein